MAVENNRRHRCIGHVAEYPNRRKAVHVMQPWTYLIVLGICLALTLPLEFVFRLRVYRNPLRLLLVLVPVVLIFSVWDTIAVGRDYWTYDPLQTLAVELPGGLPLEEVLFFVAIPICAVLTYESVERVTVLVRRILSRSKGRDKDA
ncbi:MAG: lycopene cyclase domain-containing protein [Kocuria sp.]|nr:lycopene cyclase domain-containing protein [Kocuria sp.]MDN5617886.1 lycopene cyclase domain-containing protein [Kocuria sp.]